MIERVLSFGDDGRLVGTLCLPAKGCAPVAQVLFNAGIVHRVGPHRINVRLARRLAARGIASLRFDLSGLGDSARAKETLDFERQAGLDLKAAMDALGEATGAARFALFGFCSGGRHAFALAPGEPRVAGLVLYDTFAFHTRRSRLRRYVLRAKREGLARAVAGRVARIWRGLRGGGEAGAPTSDGSYAVTPSREAFAATVGALLERGTRVALVHSGEGDNYNYEGQFRDAFAGTALAGRVSLDFFPSLDHNTMDPAEQARLLDRLEAWTADLAKESA